MEILQYGNVGGSITPNAAHYKLFDFVLGDDLIVYTPSGLKSGDTVLMRFNFSVPGFILTIPSVAFVGGAPTFPTSGQFYVRITYWDAANNFGEVLVP